MKLDLGAGQGRQLAHEEGWIAVDVNPAAADVVASVAQLPFADDSIDALSAVDVLEHLSYRDTDAVLAEWLRVAQRDASLYVQVPDAGLIMRWYVQSPQLLLNHLPGSLPQTALAGAAWRLLGGHADDVYVSADGDWRWNAHYALFTPESLRKALERAGWSVVELVVNPFPNVQAWATRR